MITSCIMFTFNDYCGMFLAVIEVIITFPTRVISGAILKQVIFISVFLFRFRTDRCKDEVFMFCQCKIYVFAHFMSGFLICGVLKFILKLLVRNNLVKRG